MAQHIASNGFQFTLGSPKIRNGWAGSGMAVIRLLTMAGGLAGAVSMSQFPEFSQQYLQRLSGAVDELRAVVVSFDQSAVNAGLTREEALAELNGSSFQSELQGNLTGQINRYERLSTDYAKLKEIEPLQRLAQVYRFNDTELARRTWSDYRPAVPVTIDGFICAAIGYAIGWLALAGVFALILRLFRRRKATPADGA